MKKTFFLTPLLLGATFLCAQALVAEEKATVTEPRINVRGQPLLYSEVITQLKQGDEVTILEKIPVPAEKQKPNEPTNWAKIKMPANTPVWAFAPFIKENKISVSRLNLRAGPGENYSVVGRLEKGTEVKPIRTQDEWMEIETPEGAYAFIDLALLQSQGTTTAPEVARAEPPPTEAAPAAVPPATAVTVPPAVTTPTEEAPTPKIEQITPPAEERKPLQVETVTPQPEVAKTQEQSTPVPRTEPPAIVAVPPPVAAPQEQPVTTQPSTEPPPGKALPKRIVRREGVVKTTRSIQAPTYYELVNPETKKTMNYIHAEPLGINLKNFRGQRVVITGEEGIDPRWPAVPVIEVDTIESAP